MKDKLNKTKIVSNFNFDYKSKDITSFHKRYNKLIKYCELHNLQIHKWRILTFYSLSLRNWRKQLNADDIKDWNKKIEYLEMQIDNANTKLIDIVLNSNNEMAIAKIIEKEQDNIFESQDNNSLALNNIVINLPESIKKEIPMKVVEINDK